MVILCRDQLLVVYKSLFTTEKRYQHEKIAQYKHKCKQNKSSEEVFHK